MIVDYSHVGRPVTGIERVALELFSEAAIQGPGICYVNARGTLGMIAAQWLRLPFLAFANPNAIIICPGFPASILLSAIAGRRVLPYIHDLFLLTRATDLNPRAKWYMRPSFRYSIKTSRIFAVNSEYTRRELRAFCRNDAEILMLRPAVRNVFDLSPDHRAEPAGDRPIRVLSIGTVEPRKNYLYGAEICATLAKRLGRAVEYHVVGRLGWGRDFEVLRKASHVVLHGYQPTRVVRSLVLESDLFMATSRDEGLGLPLLEVQYSGIPIVATQIPAFQEVLGDSTTYIEPDNVEQAADAMCPILSADLSSRKMHAMRAVENVEKWNGLAARDLALFRDWLSSRHHA